MPGHNKKHKIILKTNDLPGFEPSQGGGCIECEKLNGILHRKNVPLPA
jgi:hypothetical protein